MPHVVPRRRGRVVLTAFHGRGFRGNPRAIFEHLLAEGTLDPIWLSTDADVVETVRGLHGSDRAAFTHDAEGVRSVAQAEAIVTSHGVTDLAGLRPPAQALVIEAWHGLPTKRGELMTDAPGLRTRFDVWRNWRAVDYMLSSSPLVSRIYAERFGLRPEQMLELGYPVYDALAPGAAGVDVAALLPDAPQHTKVMLYAPTFRRRTPTRLFPFEDLDGGRLAAHLEHTDCLCLLRMHPNEPADLRPFTAMSPRIQVVGHDLLEDITRLLPVADLIVTDYSGIYLEGLLADVPCMFAPYDLETYERGLPFDYAEMTPGPEVHTLADFCTESERRLADRSLDADDRARVRDLFFARQDGRATARFCEWLVGRLGA